ncbi:MAG: RNA-directed DNA polymerase [PVC group bacterium]|nr:RNA-directed DNA polymerase [PVC group bacterium]
MPPKFDDLNSFAEKIRLSTGLIYKLYKYSDKHYKIFSIPKKSGGHRIIRAPSKPLKAIQAWILRNILSHVGIIDHATGFRNGTNILDNAAFHIDNRYFLIYDLEDFFPSIGYGRIYNIFKAIGYNSYICHVLTSLCSCEKVLPQGGVTSPILSNIICHRLDKRIIGFVGRHEVTYTRYADDLTFSATSPKYLQRIFNFVIKIIEDEGFTLNKSKTRFMGPKKRRKITGIVMSDNSLGIGKYRKRRLRAEIHNLLVKSPGPKNDETIKKAAYISGWLAFIRSIDQDGFDQLIQYLEKLIKKNKIKNSPIRYSKYQ